MLVGVVGIGLSGRRSFMDAARSSSVQSYTQTQCRTFLLGGEYQRCIVRLQRSSCQIRIRSSVGRAMRCDSLALRSKLTLSFSIYSLASMRVSIDYRSCLFFAAFLAMSSFCEAVLRPSRPRSFVSILVSAEGIMSHRALSHEKFEMV